MAVAQGPSGCSLCQPTDQEEKGVAPGVGKVLDPSGAGAESDWAAGVPYYWFDSENHRWQLQEPAPDPAQVINYSRGSDASYDDSLVAQTVDATVDSYGVTMTIAAGNSGPAARTVNDPALAFNDLAVGAFSGGGTSDPSDDRVFAWSSRGPTAGGRKKPDLVAVGDGGLADSYYQTTGKLWKYDTGTSYAAPQVGGGALLLAGAGIRDPKVVKAILINSARAGRATPSEPMGTQAGWLPDWGWGELNLDAAYHQRLNFARGEVPAGGARFFRASVQPGDRATLVWHRRVADCQPLRQGCYYDADSDFRAYTLTNLDLAEYDAATGAQRASSASAVDNVEQVRASAPGSVIYKVTAGEVDGPAGEPFAIAGTRELTALTTPQPTTELTVTQDGTRRSGEQVRVDAAVVNPSPDLRVANAAVTLTLPAGVELVFGPQTQPLGTLATKGAAGDRTSASWTVRGTTDGLKQLIATTTATGYGATFRSSATGSFSVDSMPPRVVVSAAAEPDSDGTVAVAWNATDDSPVARFDVETSLNGGPFSPWLNATQETGARLAVAPGGRYRIRVRATDALGNTSEFVTSDEIAIPDDDVAHGGSRPPDPPDRGRSASKLESPELRITGVHLKGRRLIVRGSVATGANGKVTGTWSARIHARRRTIRASTYAQTRAFRLAFKLPRHAPGRAHLTVAYKRDHHFAAATRRSTIRVAPRP
jgi:hypothetical protein